jgi:hypothetical protein
MSWVTDYFAEAEKRGAEELAEAEREAIASGKEPFDLAKLEELLNRGPQAANEKQHRVNYYISRSEMRTLAEYVARLHANEPWQDSR